MFRIKTDIRQYKCDSPDKVEKLIRNWVIRPTDLIFSAENADWRPIGDHPVFTPLFDVLNEQLRNEPDTLVTRNPFVAPPSAPDGIEISRADTDEITKMTHRTQTLRSADDDTMEIALSESALLQVTEPIRKIGRHDLPEELFATAEIHATFSRDGAHPPLDELAELAELSEIEPKLDDESTVIVEFPQDPEEESTKPIDELEPADAVEIAADLEPAADPEPTDTPEPAGAPEHADDEESGEYSRKFTETIQSSAFTRASTWEALNSPIPEENDDDLILAEDSLSTSSELDAHSRNPDSIIEACETLEFPVSDVLSADFDDENTIDNDETSDFETPAILIANSKRDDESESSDNSKSSDETSDETEKPIEEDAEVLEDITPEIPEIPEGYTVDLPPIGPTDQDIAIGIHRSTTTDEEKERVFHTPEPQPLTVVMTETFHLSRHATHPTSSTTLDLPAPATSTSDANAKNNKTTTYIVAAVVLLIVVVIIAALAN